MGDATLKTKSNSIFREIWKHKLCYLAILPSIAFLLFFCLYPAFTGVFRSFFRWKTKNYFSPEFCGFDNYARLFRDKTFWTSFGTLFIILAAVSLFSPVIKTVIASKKAKKQAAAAAVNDSESAS